MPVLRGYRQVTSAAASYCCQKEGAPCDCQAYRDGLRRDSRVDPRLLDEPIGPTPEMSAAKPKPSELDEVLSLLYEIKMKHDDGYKPDCIAPFSFDLGQALDLLTEHRDELVTKEEKEIAIN